MMRFSKCYYLCLAAGMALSASSAHASGFVAGRQESMVREGMSADSVRQALGAPANSVRYANESGPTWEYRARNGARDANYIVQFDAEGKVAATLLRTANGS